jgi:hypothetical protein
MRKRIVFGISMFLGMVMLVAWAESNWFLAGVLGLMLGATIAIAIFAFPHDAAPPADRRHENTQRRRREQALKG